MAQIKPVNVPAGKQINWTILQTIALFLIAAVLVGMFVIPAIAAYFGKTQQRQQYEYETEEAKLSFIASESYKMTTQRLKGQRFSVVSISPPKQGSTWFQDLSYKKAIRDGTPLRYFGIRFVIPKDPPLTLKETKITFYTVMGKTRSGWEPIDHYDSYIRRP